MFLAPRARSSAALGAFMFALACSGGLGDSTSIVIGQSGGNGGTGGSSNGSASNGGASATGGASNGGPSTRDGTSGGASSGGSTMGGSLGTSGGASSGGAKTSGGAFGAGMTGVSGGSFGGGGAAGSGGSGGAVTGTFASVSAYLSGYCATSTACHGTGASRVVLRGTALYGTLTSKTVAKCSGEALVVPNDPAASALYDVLTGGCGKFFMPPACTSAPCGTADNIKLVETWIKSGAPNN
jgi:hypothetical protein